MEVTVQRLNKEKLMRICENTIVGTLSDSENSAAIPLHMGYPVLLEGMHIFPFWPKGDKLCLLCLMTPGKPLPHIKIAGRRQAGAFLLQPEKNFSLIREGKSDRVYTFHSAGTVPVITGKDHYCIFCRNELNGAGIGVIDPAGHLENWFRGKILCYACAAALGCDGGMYDDTK